MWRWSVEALSRSRERSAWHITESCSWDELPEFNRSVLEVMRQPLEDRTITVSRARLSVDYPANFMLVASMNPCPCGYYNHPDRPCLCSPGAVQKYMNRVSGPLLDRIDIQVEVVPVPFREDIRRTLFRM